MFLTHHYFLLGTCHRWQNINRVSWEISSLIGSFVNAMRPTRVEDLLSCVLIQNDQVSLQKAQECCLRSSCRKTTSSQFTLRAECLWACFISDVFKSTQYNMLITIKRTIDICYTQLENQQKLQQLTWCCGKWRNVKFLLTDCMFCFLQNKSLPFMLLYTYSLGISLCLLMSWRRRKDMSIF